MCIRDRLSAAPDPLGVGAGRCRLNGGRWVALPAVLADGAARRRPGAHWQGVVQFLVFPAVVWAVCRCRPDVDVQVLAENSDRVG
eukprot:9629150-Alexandrium_andersonii.AAC.1